MEYSVIVSENSNYCIELLLTIYGTIKQIQNARKISKSWLIKKYPVNLNYKRITKSLTLFNFKHNKKETACCCFKRNTKTANKGLFTPFETVFSV